MKTITLFLLISLSEIITATRLDDTTQVGLRLPQTELWKNLQFENIVDFLFPNHITAYTKPSSKTVILTLPSGETLTITHQASDHLKKAITLLIAPSPNAIIKHHSPLVKLFFQAYPYNGFPNNSVLKTSFHISKSSEKAQAIKVIEALTRSLHDTLRNNYGAFPCMQQYRTYAGTCNNHKHLSWGAYKTPLTRFQSPKDPFYKPGTNEYAKQLPNARTVSTKLFSEPGKRSSRGVTMMTVFWGQFIDHDIDLTPETAHSKEERMDIEIEDTADIMYARHKGKLSFTRSAGANNGRKCCGNGISERIPRDHINAVSAYIDASQVYGCERDRVTSLRKWKNGEMIVSKSADGRDMLPQNDGKLGIKLDNAPNGSDEMFVAGDIRVNEQPVLASLHTIFVREHNRLSRILRSKVRCTGEERIFQYSRKIVSAQIQFITYKFFLPALLGKHGLTEYKGYNPAVNPSITNFFSTCAFRFGHSMVADTLKILVKRSRPHPKDGIRLHETFFDPSFVKEVGIEPLLLGSSHQLAEAADMSVVNSLQNELFKKITGGIDLVAKNIQRGRDHGLPGYNDARELHGLKRVASFKEVSSDVSVQNKLAEVYKSVNDIDPFVGGLAEHPLKDSELGELFTTAVRDQFKRLRDGDKFFYENLEWPSDIANLDDVKEITEGRLTLESIITRNSGGRLTKEDFPKNVFIGFSE